MGAVMRHLPSSYAVPRRPRCALKIFAKLYAHMPLQLTTRTISCNLSRSCYRWRIVTIGKNCVRISGGQEWRTPPRLTFRCPAAVSLPFSRKSNRHTETNGISCNSLITLKVATLDSTKITPPRLTPFQTKYVERDTFFLTPGLPMPTSSSRSRSATANASSDAASCFDSFPSNPSNAAAFTPGHASGRIFRLSLNARHN
jgi:hypothetical protein